MQDVTVEYEERAYEAVVTDIGNALMMNAVANGGKISIVSFAVGDGGGDYYRPETGMEQLKNEVWRGVINSCKVSNEANNILLVSAVCPGDVGGFTIREMGVFDSEGNMIAVCNCPATPKVTIVDGVINEMRLEMEIALINGNAVELVVDPNIVTATKKDVEEVWEALRENGRVTIGKADSPMEENEIRLIVDAMPY